MPAAWWSLRSGGWRARPDRRRSVSGGQTRRRPSLRAVFTNWRESELPFHRKVGAVIRNNWTKLRTRRGCCGHPGEPGC